MAVAAIRLCRRRWREVTDGQVRQGKVEEGSQQDEERKRADWDGNGRDLGSS